jgi:peptidoglycan/LPS O-acetylase OafA/YrhL
MSTEKIYFKNLDSLRFIAALMVYLQHGFGNAYHLLPIKGTVWERLLDTICNGEMGVSIFFVLSGFLITYLLISEHEQNGRISLPHFYLRRVLRIWPLYYLVVCFSFLVYPFLKSLIGLNNPLGSNLSYHLTFLSNFDVLRMKEADIGNAALSQNITWSVSIEEQFYLFWPLQFLLLPRKYWGYSTLLVIVASIVFRLCHTGDKNVLYFHTLSVLMDLGIGGLVAYLIKRSKGIRSYFENTTSLFHASVFILSFSLMFFKDYLFSFKYGDALERVFISISFVLIIAAQAMTKSNSKLDLNRLSFANKWGKYTYGIYLIHPIALTILDIVSRVLHIKQENFATLSAIAVLGFFLTLLLSWISYTYYESRFLKLKNRFTELRYKFHQ